MINFREKANFIWSVADLLGAITNRQIMVKGFYPLTISGRFDCLLKGTKEKVIN